MVKMLLKDVRHAKNMTTTALSEITGVSRSHIIEIEEGRASPTIDVLCRLAKGLGVSPEHLYKCCEK